jgi:hypothetical protein
MNFKKISTFVGHFCLPGSGSGSTDPIESGSGSGSNPDPDPDPQPWFIASEPNNLSCIYMQFFAGISELWSEQG